MSTNSPADTDPPSEVSIIDEPLDETNDVVKKKLGLGFWFSAFWLALMVIAAIGADWLPFVQDPGEINIQDKNQAPTAAHWFGTDNLGTDVFAKVAHGARPSLLIGVIAIALGMVLGGTFGIVAGFFGGIIDRVISFLFACLLSFPALILAILIVTFIDRTLFWIAITLGVLGIAPIGLLARAVTLTVREREFVTAAEALGAKPGRIMVREILPNVLIPMSALALLGMAVAIVAEGGLAFLGLSVDPAKETTWGIILQQASGSGPLSDHGHIALFTVLVFFLTVFALNLAGDRIRAYFDIRDISL